MAKQDHLNKLHEGVSAWNEWRKSKPNEVPDLIEANLSGLDLKNVDFSKARMLGVDLFKTDLTKANLSSAILSSHHKKGILRETTLTEANMEGADLYEANLIGAKLMRIEGAGMILSWSDCTNTDFTGAQLQNALMRGANFKMALNNTPEK